jgi:oligopeptide transport system permease protein
MANTYFKTPTEKESFPFDPSCDAAKALRVPSEMRHTNLWQDAWRKFFKNKLAVVGLVVMIIIIILVVGADFFQRYGPTDRVFDRSPGAPPLYKQSFQPPSADHWFGTDSLNRDLWSRMLHGGRTSLLVGVVAQLLVLVVGVPLGLMAGFFGGKVDAIISFFINVFYAFPAILVGLLLLSVFGSSLVWVLLGIAMGMWPRKARLVRGLVLSLREKEFIEAARAIGVKPWKIMFRHILPNTMGPLIVSVSFGIPLAIQIEAFYGFIGIGVTPPATSWGQLVTDGYHAFQSHPPTILIIPALAMALTCMSLNFIGDGLRDALDPRTKHQE